MTLASLHIGPIQFEQPFWLLLLPVCGLAAVWMARRSLSGMGTLTRRVALLVRLIVIALLAGVLAKPHWREEARNVAVTAIVDMSRSVPLDRQAAADRYLKDATRTAERGDLLGRVTAAQDAYVQAIPKDPGDLPDAQMIGSRNGTNLADAVRLALAIGAKDAANRIVLMSDGNETAGSLLSMAETARALRVPIDVLPLRYEHEREVIVERIMAPATARMGENANLRILINATKPAVGRLSLTVNGQALDLDPDGESMSQVVSLEAGTNPIQVPVTLPQAGPQQFEALFEPLTKEEKIRLGVGDPDAVEDSVQENNRAMAVTFVSSEGRVLVLAPSPDEAAPLTTVLNGARIEAEVRRPEDGPQSLIDLGGYDAVVMVNTPVYSYSQQQQEDLRSFVHDLGGGLIMVGGPNSFGAGGWIGSPLADALPVKLDPPQKKDLPKLALVMIMHACEMPQGNYWGKQTALGAIEKLTRLDMAGVIECQWGANSDYGWVYQLQPIGDKTGIRQAINNMQHGDAQSFVNMMQAALTALKKASASQKHVILVSDGDPQGPPVTMLQEFKDNQISCSTIMVFPHTPAGGPDIDKMRFIANRTGGTFHSLTQGMNPATLPEIVIRDVIEHRRTLIWEGDAFSPSLTNAPSDPMRGIRGPFPPITGYIVTADREGLSQVSLRGQENDPIVAHWQYGLGRSVAITTDAATRWSTTWPGWGQYRSFWEQHVRWAMRPNASADIRVVTEDLGGQTKLIIEALDRKGERLDFVRWQGRVSGPKGGLALTPRQVGPGRYEAVFDSMEPGAYVMSLRYTAPGGADEDKREGSVQAAVTRPFADEFRALKDNSALLRQVATATGGLVLAGDPEKDLLWRREGLSMPVALTPIWLLVTMITLGLFLLDVAVRRVRIDIPAMGRAVVVLISRGRAKSGEQMGALKEARERAKQSMQARSTPGPAGESAALPISDGATPQPAASAAAKFEATDDELRRARRAAGPLAGEAEETRPEPRAAGAEQDNKGEPPEGMSRLLKAKRRARDEMSQDEQEH